MDSLATRPANFRMGHCDVSSRGRTHCPAAWLVTFVPEPMWLRTDWCGTETPMLTAVGLEGRMHAHAATT